jgi:hypothetical protein
MPAWYNDDIHNNKAKQRDRTAGVRWQLLKPIGAKQHLQPPSDEPDFVGEGDSADSVNRIDACSGQHVTLTSLLDEELTPGQVELPTDDDDDDNDDDDDDGAGEKADGFGSVDVVDAADALRFRLQVAFTPSQAAYFLQVTTHPLNRTPFRIEVHHQELLTDAECELRRRMGVSQGDGDKELCESTVQ